MPRMSTQRTGSPPKARAAKTTKAAVKTTKVTRLDATSSQRRIRRPLGTTAAKKTIGKQTASRIDALERVVHGFVAAARTSDLPERLIRLDDPEAFGAELVALVSARATWEAALGRYLSVAEAAKVLGVSSRQAVHQRLARGTLLGMDLAGQTVLPAYQFDGSTVWPEVVQVLKLLRPAGLSDEATVSWFASPQPELDGVTPSQWLGNDPTRLYEAARHTAGALSH